MNFWKNIFTGKPDSSSKNIRVKRAFESSDYYANSWVNNHIPKWDRETAEFIFRAELDKRSFETFLPSVTDFDMGGSGWQEIGFLNFPGPFYTGESDSCGTGIREAPANVIFDEYCHEHVMIQPRNRQELTQLLGAGAVEVFSSYYCDGNMHWTVPLVKEWWSNRGEIMEHLKNEELISMNCYQEIRYAHYLAHFAELDLRKYCFFLEHGFYPREEALPELT